MTDPVTTILRDYPAVVLDGALATELERRGCDLDDPLWSAKLLIERPELIRQLHADYFVAGADCAISASYQASFAGFARRGIGETEAAELMARSVRLAAEARDGFWADAGGGGGRPRPFVAASVGPYGAILHDGSEYRGDYGLSEAALADFHRPRIAVLLAAGADLLACETIPCLAEARALLRLLGEFPAARAWVSFSARDEAHTAQGEPLAACLAEVGAHPQVVAVGVNCTAPRFIPAIVAAARAATDRPIVVYPNSGERFEAATNSWAGEAACDAFASDARAWYVAGARLIGGCCRTTPEHIRELAAWVREMPGPGGADRGGPATAGDLILR